MSLTYVFVAVFSVNIGQLTVVPLIPDFLTD